MNDWLKIFDVLVKLILLLAVSMTQVTIMLIAEVIVIIFLPVVVIKELFK